MVEPSPFPFQGPLRADEVVGRGVERIDLAQRIQSYDKDGLLTSQDKAGLSKLMTDLGVREVGRAGGAAEERLHVSRGWLLENREVAERVRRGEVSVGGDRAPMR